MKMLIPDNYDLFDRYEAEAAREERLRRRQEWDYGEGADWRYEQHLEEEEERRWRE